MCRDEKQQQQQKGGVVYVYRFIVLRFVDQLCVFGVLGVCDQAMVLAHTPPMPSWMTLMQTNERTGERWNEGNELSTQRRNSSNNNYYLYIEQFNVQLEKEKQNKNQNR